ncbi:threonine/alanine tRNA ligase second additional domain protein [Necator americanus]|uniref:Threonine/alanine tRNA ligase second additional domain protein n=1 Tax=Necator americanus TaxID=51031 RepID=W2T8K0_NECAM|nr:threonine/alanine tRNA ligase second additional domain protein [Necator americanus]ETN78320.1 threonine/alanine tRNA ligase second additional domain protein [Necator americanus]
MLRRSFWHASAHLGIERFACSELVPVVIETLRQAYPDLDTAAERIQKCVADEENHYWKVVDMGQTLFQQMRLKMPEGATVFPVFCDSERVNSISSSGSLVLEECQFFAEEGGQKCDKGVLEVNEVPVFEVSAVEKIGDLSVLHGEVIGNNNLAEGSRVRQRIHVGKEYPEVVRVVCVGDSLDDAVAVECCSGTHVLNTSSLIDFAVISDRSSARGVRRILALTGEKARQCWCYGKQVLVRLESLRDLPNGMENSDIHKEEIQWTRMPYQYNVRARKLLKLIKKKRKLKNDTLLVAED